jgi:hypothetical protein
MLARVVSYKVHGGDSWAAAVGRVGGFAGIVSFSVIPLEPWALLHHVAGFGVGDVNLRDLLLSFLVGYLTKLKSIENIWRRMVDDIVTIWGVTIEGVWVRY